MNRTILEQVADLLLSEQDQHGDVRLSQGSVAELLGASRQSVNEAISVLKSAGAVETGYRLIRIVDSGAVVHASICDECKKQTKGSSDKQHDHAFRSS